MGASSTRSFWPSLMLPSRARGPSAVAIALISSGLAPRSRSTAATESVFLSAIERSVQALPPLVCVAVFATSVMFSGAMRVPKPA